ncbi:GNAT family N-acetyltransferase [Bradyrhizobium sp. WSM3983]|uniref:GNAT family N-acetyltransferase n=1 Tax=Bradyrhizobium sp. WSM3983 TaxID=1038867 RepID=UPI000684EFD6|nr:GNAT family N-acetyltransferase [Bradyrhizobium sp. WSM3983]
MEETDLDDAWNLSQRFLWPHRREDRAFLLELGEGLVAEVDGRVRATIMAFRYGPALATVGIVIVDKWMQGQGVARELMLDVMARLKGCTIVLQATPSGASLYAKLGFEDIGLLYQHQGIAPAAPQPTLSPGERIRSIGSADSHLATLYSQASCSDRSDLAKALFAQEKGIVLTRDDTPVGFAMLRQFGKGWCIAPVVAIDLNAAKALILHWVAVNTDRFTRVDVAGDEVLSKWLTELGLPQISGTQTMAHGGLPTSPKAYKVFAVTAHALGEHKASRRLNLGPGGSHARKCWTGCHCTSCL